MKLYHFLSFLGFFVLFTQCEKSSSTFSLSQTEASERDQLVTNIQYDLLLDISNENNFTGKLILNFELKNLSSLRLDFHSGKLTEWSINNAIQEPISVEGSLNILESKLNLGNNQLIISFEKPYSRTGTGLHRFVDPDDQNIYFFTQFEAYHANELFPCFDQPNLKAILELKVIAPKDWKVISTSYAESIDLDKVKNLSLHRFPKTPVLSSYLFSLHAGPYEEWIDSWEKVPLRLYSRKSMAKFVDSNFWFQQTKLGLKYFENYFGIPYPFSKYDQIIVPEFNAGAMENVGAVTFSERFLSRGYVTRSQKENLGNVILHEMAHMWFGNLVTMQWWDDLWLNESFATFMATKAQAESSEFHEAWETFHQKMKAWAYEEDSLSTNHPIKSSVNNTEEATTQFDGITYGKGAAVLQQLEFLVGEGAFRSGVTSYLKDNSFKNATLKDFLQSIQTFTSVNLDTWSRQWLETKGTNHFYINEMCYGDKIKLIIKQSGDRGELTNRIHKLNLLFFTKDGPKDLSLTLDQKRQILSLNQITCSYFILWNYLDKDYSKQALNLNGLHHVDLVLDKIPDSLSKTMLWTQLWESVGQGNLSLNSFLVQVEKEWRRSDHLKWKKWVLGILSSESQEGFIRYISYLNEKDRSEIRKQLYTFIYRELNEAEPASDLQKYLFGTLREISSEPNELQILWDTYTEKRIWIGFKLDPDIKWSILLKLKSFNWNSEVLENEIQVLSEIDKSLRGRNYKLVSKYISPNPILKKEAIELLRKPKSNQFSLNTLKQLSYQLFPFSQKDLENSFQIEILSLLKDFPEETDESYKSSLTRSLVSNECTLENWKRIDFFLWKNPFLSTIVKIELQKKSDLIKQCILSRKKIEKS